LLWEIFPLLRHHNLDPIQINLEETCQQLEKAPLLGVQGLDEVFNDDIVPPPDPRAV